MFLQTESEGVVLSLLRHMQRALFLMNDARYYICIQPVTSRRAGYEICCSKIAEAYSDVLKGFK